MNLLIIEDDKDLAQVIAAVVEETGRQTTLATNKREIQAALKSSYDAIILDIVMPEMDGHEVLSLLSSEHCSAKIIVITGEPLYLDTAKIMGKGLGLNVIGTLKKPLDMAELKALLMPST